MRKAKRKAAKKTLRKASAELSESAERILRAVQAIPRGKVSTYGAIAEVAGLPRRARLVGTVLRQTTRRVPWHRVINSAGRISFPQGSDAYARQRARLETEGVLLIGGRIELAKYGWPSRVASLDEYLWSIRG
jgi:methylated-DNA-protein-cysteine methyltransferase-like protein